MKFVVSSALLSARLQSLGRVIVSKNSLPILDCFLFDVHGGVLTLTASDNETTLVSDVELVECEADFRFAMNAKTIQDAMKEIPEQPLSFFVNEQTLEVIVVYQNGEYRLMAQAADDYPNVSIETNNMPSVCVSSNLLSTGISRALFAAADDLLRPVMNGVFVDCKEQALTVVASDGHKLSCSTFGGVQSSEQGHFILPKKPALLLKNFLPKEDGDVRLCFGEKSAVVYSSNFTMCCRLVEGRYPNYASVIPQDNPNHAVVNRGALLSALRRVLIFSSASNALIKLRLEMGRLTISSQDIDFSMSAEESLLCDYSGMPLNIGFKGTFLVELLANIDSDEVLFKLADASRAGVIEPAVQSETECVQMLLMPMMLN